MWPVLVLLLHCATFLSGRQWGDDPRILPRYYSEADLHPINAKVRQEIVDAHNHFRTKVTPTASNMLMMSWHDGAATQAQAYAEECVFMQHNAASFRENPPLGLCGQNLFVSSNAIPWYHGLEFLFEDSRNFIYGARNMGMFGHYTQMVWSATHKVGCGIAHCTGGPMLEYYNYVCHYCPAGNDVAYKVGPPCADCPEACNKNGLCTNACNFKDYNKHCDGIISRPGLCSGDICNATCNCGDKMLHRNYPW